MAIEAKTSISKVWAFFKESFTGLTQFKVEWDQLTETDKENIRQGIENGTLTY